MMLAYSSTNEGSANMNIKSLSLGFAALTMIAAAQTTFAARELSPLCQAANAVQNQQILPYNVTNNVYPIYGTGYAGETYTVELVEVTHPFLSSFFADYYHLSPYANINQDGMNIVVGQQSSFTLPSDASMKIELWYYSDPTAHINVTMTCTAGPDVIPPAPGEEMTAGIPCDNVDDGRLNSSPALDCAAPVAVYWSDAGLDVYSVNPDNGDGVFTVRLTQAEIDAAGEGNVLLAEIANPYTGDVVRVYKLAGGLIQINTTYADGKEYTIQFDGEGTLNHIAA
jgi:hypothetical protein